jgi:hypothetical protein
VLSFQPDFIILLLSTLDYLTNYPVRFPCLNRGRDRATGSEPEPKWLAGTGGSEHWSSLPAGGSDIRVDNSDHRHHRARVSHSAAPVKHGFLETEQVERHSRLPLCGNNAVEDAGMNRTDACQAPEIALNPDRSRRAARFLEPHHNRLDLCPCRRCWD